MAKVSPEVEWGNRCSIKELLLECGQVCTCSSPMQKCST